MTDLNHFSIRGRLTADAKEGLKTSPTGFAYGTFCVAVNRSMKNKAGDWEDVGHFLNFHAMGKAYESAVKHLVKGSIVVVEGHIEQDRWKDKEGKSQSKMVLCADRIYPTYQKGASTQGSYQEETPSSPEEFQEDIPF